MAFRVGQKVVCIRGGRTRYGYGDEQFPIEGQIYTIRDFSPVTARGADEAAVWLEEIVNPERQYQEGYLEPPFGVSRFRPLVERKTDISIFTAMLTPKKKRVSA